MFYCPSKANIPHPGILLDFFLSQAPLRRLCSVNTAAALRLGPREALLIVTGKFRWLLWLAAGGKQLPVLGWHQALLIITPVSHLVCFFFFPSGPWPVPAKELSFLQQTKDFLYALIGLVELHCFHFFSPPRSFLQKALDHKCYWDGRKHQGILLNSHLSTSTCKTSGT